MKRKFGAKKQGDDKDKNETTSRKPKMPVRGNQSSNADLLVGLEIPVQKESDIVNTKNLVESTKDEKSIEQKQPKTVNHELKKLATTINCLKIKNQQIDVKFEIKSEQEHFQNKIFGVDTKNFKMNQRQDSQEAPKQKQLLENFNSEQCQNYIYKFVVRQENDLLEKLYSKNKIIEQFSFNESIEAN